MDAPPPPPPGFALDGAKPQAPPTQSASAAPPKPPAGFSLDKIVDRFAEVPKAFAEGGRQANEQLKQDFTTPIDKRHPIVDVAERGWCPFPACTHCPDRLGVGGWRVGDLRGPPSGILDKCFHGERVGCSQLLEKVKKIKPTIHAFGHIHEEYGISMIDETTYINACNLNEKYIVANPPIDFELNL